MPRRKVTPFARFLLAMIIIIPLAFAGASYINGEDPIANFKSFTGLEKTAQPQEAHVEAPAKKQAAEPQSGDTETATLKAENQRLKKEIKNRDEAIKDLQEQLKNCQ